MKTPTKTSTSKNKTNTRRPSVAKRKNTASSAEEAKAVKVTTPVVADTKGSACSGKSCGKGTCSCQEDMTDAFIKEVNEEVQNDNLKVLWNKYGIFVILFVVLAVCSAVGFETIRGWREAQYQARTENYMAALQGSENAENTLKALEKIASGNNGVYSELAKIQIAGVLMEQDRAEEAQNMLQAIVSDDEVNPRIAHLAALKLATYKMDTASTEELEALLNPLVEANDAWTPLATEMLAMVAIRDGNIQKAREIYQGLLQNSELSPNFQGRILDMLSVLSDM